LLNAAELSGLAAQSQLFPDDFICLPFHPSELLLRVERLLNRDVPCVSPVVVGPLSARPEKRLVHVGQRRLRLTAREFDLLMLLMRSPGQVFTQHEIMRYIWERPSGQSNNLVPVYVNRLRAKLASVGADKALRTIRGVGYMMADPEVDSRRSTSSSDIFRERS
jgi:DNA-binding response OmpR family regulator